MPALELCQELMAETQAVSYTLIGQSLGLPPMPRKRAGKLQLNSLGLFRGLVFRDYPTQNK